MADKAKVKPCRCGAVRFPHRPHSVDDCEAEREYSLADILDNGWLCSRPGREHFANDREYEAARNQR
jgi:hypothetical protein